MSSEQDYIDVEAEWIDKWPPSQADQLNGGQYLILAEELKKNVRLHSVNHNFSPDKHGSLLSKAKDLFDDLRLGMNYTADFSEEQSKKFDDKCYWYHKDLYQDGLLNTDKDVWPISRMELVRDIELYLKMPWMWSSTLDYLLTDALIYAEIADYKGSLEAKKRLWRLTGETPWFLKLGMSTTKWLTILVGLAVAHEVSSELFLALAIAVIAYQYRISIRESPESKSNSLYAEMVGVYSCCKFDYYNPSVIWDMCAVVRDKGAVFDAAFYNLLEKQITKNKRRWTEDL